CEQYDGYDDIYGHSVEEDYCISPSDAAEFMFDRSRRQPQMSAYFNEENDIAEEDELHIDSSQRASGYQTPGMNEEDEARLRSCLDEIRNVIGDSIPEHILIDTVLKNDFNFNRSLDAVLSNNSAQKSGDAPKPQRERRNRDRGTKQVTGPPDVPDDPAVLQANTVSPSIKIVPPGTKTVNITKGFDVLPEKIETDCNDGLKPESNTTSPRSQSPSSGRISPANVDSEIIENSSDKKTLAKEIIKMPARSRENKVDVLAQYQQDRGKSKEQLHMVVIGHVDAGKSTLMGHLLFSMGQVNKKTMHKYEQESKKLGKQSFVYAWILDETGEERSRGITMDVGQSKFETASKVVTLLDAPGHKDFIPNMITGATQADVALLVVDATRGEFETGFESGGQTREHALLVRSLGVSQLGVVVNKLDTVGWSQERFEEIVGKLAPREDMLIQWYKGPCLLDVIDKFKSPERPITKPFRLSVNDI
ncbi:hypothetical protein L9F63_020282, partial [Diploptera punctata]